MTREREFERQLADWLGDGPLDAPEGAIDAAVAHALAHPRRRRLFGDKWRTPMNADHLSQVAPGARRTGSVAFAAIAVVIVVAMAAASGALLLNRGQTGPAVPGSSPSSIRADRSASPELTASLAASSTAGSIIYSDRLLRVTGVQGSRGGSTCGATYCWIIQWVKANDDRLSGCYIMIPAGSTTDATWGTIDFYAGSDCSAYSRLSPSTWVGEWFTAGARPVQTVEGFKQLVVYPIDTIWLHGRGANEGLSALLHMEDDTHIDGWIYPTPTS